jgi:hypothetical protein
MALVLPFPLTACEMIPGNNIATVESIYTSMLNTPTVRSWEVYSKMGRAIKEAFV